MQERAFTTTPGDRCSCVTVRGDVDLGNAKDLATAMSEAAASGPIVVDLSDCSYLDSTGLSIFVRHERNHRGKLVIVAPERQRSVRIFEITGLALTLTLRASLEDAYAVFASRELSA